MEDHDRSRSRVEYENGILEDLAWLGFVAGGPPARQSERLARYAAALASLTDRGLTYWCDCSRQTVRTDGGTIGGELRYSGRCRDRQLGPGGDRGVRVRFDEGDERFDDGRLGPQIQRPSAQCGDVLARDRHGHWTYQFAVTVDDMQDGIDLVVRGMDLLPSTGRQIALARLLGRPRPAVFVHHPLILAPSGEKLSKSNRDVGLAALRADGVSAEDAIGRAAAAVGLTEMSTAVAASDVAGLVRK
jgi:glutamyl-tRNA synthetase/glutamyl-Q tRNA(Asp) synthetase